MSAAETPRFYRWVSGADRLATADVGPRQRAWIDGRMNYLGLVHAQNALAVEVRLGSGDPMRLTALGADRTEGPTVRVVLEVGIEDPAGEPPAVARSVLGKARQRLARTNPVAADELRQRELSLRYRLAHRRATAVDSPLMEPPSEARVGSPVAVLVGMYWFELGGAEKWAFRTLDILRDNQLLPVVVVDAPSAHRLITHPSLDGCVVIVADRDNRVEGELMLRSLLARLELAGVLLHHSHLLYALLPLLAALRPRVPVVDSLHVVEWEDGGFPLLSARYGHLVGTRHVISPALATYLRTFPRVDASSVVVAPLLALGSAGIDRDISEHRDLQDEVVLGFVGRFVDQKRPYLVLEIMRRLMSGRSTGRYRALIHGDGPNRQRLEELVDQWGLAGLVEFRSSTRPVADTYREIDVLLIPSQIEGLTLTAMEATAAGVVVLSADVGAQRSLVADEALLPRYPWAFVRGALQFFAHVREDPAWASTLLREQRAKATALADLPDAEEWMTILARRWAVDSDAGDADQHR